MFGALLLIVLAADEPARTAPATADQLRFFETSVRPVLVEHCWKCHGSKKQWAGLRLDSRDALMRGGDSGAAIVPGEPNKSLLIRAVRHEDENLKMPEEGKLSDRQIADLVRWVEMGAPFPESSKTKTRTRDPQHWAFQPPQGQPLPPVKNEAWAATAVDKFVLSKLEAAGITPAEKADKRTLIRRVTFDLTGLPPTLAEIEAFLADERADAFAQLVERLLASPAYGEKWGRHWLDVARYADSNGLDENIAHGNAWRYRDHVVAAFNRDQPFDRFLAEQLAGDLLPADSEAQRHEQLIATGFLSIGPKVLAEVDQAKMRMDIVDEQLDTIGRAFLGLTLGCARCHDHKFDPIDAADYYGLAGILKSTKTMDTYTKVAKWHENELSSATLTAMRAEYESQLAAKKRAVEEFITEADKQVREKLAAEGNDKPPEKLEPLYPDATKAELTKLREALATLEKNPPDYPAAMGVSEDEITDLAIHLRGNPLKLGDVIPRRTPPALRGPQSPPFSKSASGRLELARWLTDPKHPLTARVFVNRVWRWHFGTGLVRTTDNFGLLGEQPSHPELLDWLAVNFMKSGWSVKWLHRQLLLSATWQQSSQLQVLNVKDDESNLAPNNRHLALDADNRLFGRANVRRLEAEEVRDSLLSVSGQLDSSFGGSMLTVKNRGYLFDHTSIDKTDYNSRRRSLYLPIIRNHVFDLFQLLDFPDPAVPAGDRATTTVAPQALLMLNSDFVMQSADELAARQLVESSDDDQRLTRLYVLAYGREPSVDERSANRTFIAKIEQSLVTTEPNEDNRRQQAWSVLCHVTLAANEFIYVR